MNYDFYQNCIDIKYYKSDMYISNICNVLDCMKDLGKMKKSIDKRIELKIILDYYEL
jgi:hypothetical protein